MKDIFFPSAADVYQLQGSRFIIDKYSQKKKKNYFHT